MGGGDAGLFDLLGDVGGIIPGRTLGANAGDRGVGDTTGERRVGETSLFDLLGDAGATIPGRTLGVNAGDRGAGDTGLGGSGIFIGRAGAGAGSNCRIDGR